MDITRYYLSFRVGNEWYGVNVDDVVQVLHFLALTELPVSRPEVLGLATVREEIMPVIDLRRFFGVANQELRMDSPVIAVRSSRGPVALIADEAQDVIAVSPKQYSSYDAAESSYLKGVLRLEKRLLLLLDAAKLRDEVPAEALAVVEGEVA